MRASDYEGDLNEFLRKYSYQPELTPKLDGLKDQPFTQAIVNEIVLWKVNRYASVSSGILATIESLRKLSAGEHRQAGPALEPLLKLHGIDLPMASTLLRFRNSRVFQIIDTHAYRAVYGSDYPLKRYSPTQEKVSVYFDYLDSLLELCEKRTLEFESIDRLLYVFDKEPSR